MVNSSKGEGAKPRVLQQRKKELLKRIAGLPKTDGEVDLTTRFLFKVLLSSFKKSLEIRL